MSDKTGRDTGQNMRQGVTVEDAATALGLTVAAVRKRLERGQLEGERVGRRWVVYLGDDATGQDNARRQPRQTEADALREHIADLREQLRVKDAQLAHLTVTVERLTRALPAPTPEGEATSAPTAKRRWWPF